jgi:hypothetical protein
MEGIYEAFLSSALAGPVAWPWTATVAAIVTNLKVIHHGFDSRIGQMIHELNGVENAVLNGGDAWAKTARFVVQEAPDPNASANTFVFGMLNIPTAEWMNQTLTLNTEIPAAGG